jgi:hypothetical protein
MLYINVDYVNGYIKPAQDKDVKYERIKYTPEAKILYHFSWF